MGCPCVLLQCGIWVSQEAMCVFLRLSRGCWLCPWRFTSLHPSIHGVSLAIQARTSTRCVLCLLTLTKSAYGSAWRGSKDKSVLPLPGRWKVTGIAKCVFSKQILVTWARSTAVPNSLVVVANFTGCGTRNCGMGFLAPRALGKDFWN